MNKEEIELIGYAEIKHKRDTITMSEQTIKLSKLEEIINKKVIDFIKKYMRQPRYMKVPLWIKKGLVRNIPKSNIKIDFIKETFKYKNMTVCETITISKPKEIEEF